MISQEGRDRKRRERQYDRAGVQRSRTPDARDMGQNCDAVSDVGRPGKRRTRKKQRDGENLRADNRSLCDGSFGLHRRSTVYPNIGLKK